jgi:hypothetical protein
MPRTQTKAGLAAPGDLVAFDWRGSYLAEGLAPRHGDKDPTAEWVELVPGDPGLIVTVTPGADKPYVVLLGRQNRLVKLSASMVKKAGRRKPPA